MTTPLDLSQFVGFTPGPWHWYPARTQQHLHDARGVAFAQCSMPKEAKYPHYANDARLIAAAPALLALAREQAAQIEALRASLIDMMGAVKVFHGPDCWEIYDKAAPEMIRARAALNANGGAQG